MGAPVLAYMLQVAEANPRICAHMDTLGASVVHTSSKRALEGRFTLPTATP